MRQSIIQSVGGGWEFEAETGGIIFKLTTKNTHKDVSLKDSSM